MKYDKVDLLQLIDLSFKGLERDINLQAYYRLSPYEILRIRDVMRSLDVLQGLEIIFNCIYPQTEKSESAILQAARHYPLEILGLSPRVEAALRRTNKYGEIATVANLLRLTDYEISKIRGIGQGSKAMADLQEKRQKFLDDYKCGRLKEPIL